MGDRNQRPYDYEWMMPHKTPGQLSRERRGSRKALAAFALGAVGLGYVAQSDLGETSAYTQMIDAYRNGEIRITVQTPQGPLDLANMNPDQTAQLLRQGDTSNVMLALNSPDLENFCAYVVDPSTLRRLLSDIGRITPGTKDDPSTVGELCKLNGNTMYHADASLGAQEPRTSIATASAVFIHEPMPHPFEKGRA